MCHFHLFPVLDLEVTILGVCCIPVVTKNFDINNGLRGASNFIPLGKAAVRPLVNTIYYSRPQRKLYSILSPNCAHWSHIQCSQVCNITHCLQKALLQDLSSKERNVFSIIQLVRQPELPAKPGGPWRNVRFELMQSSPGTLNLKTLTKLRSRQKAEAVAHCPHPAEPRLASTLTAGNFLISFSPVTDLHATPEGCLLRGAVQHRAPV